MSFQLLSNDQRRELVNSQQRYAVWRRASNEMGALKGSMVWKTKSGAEYLVRSSYEGMGRIRRQKSCWRIPPTSVPTAKRRSR